MKPPLHDLHDPPRLALKVLRRFCAPRWVEEIEGDLAEQFVGHVHDIGLFAARVLCWRDVLLFVARPYLARRQPLDYNHARGPFMLKNYLKIAFRNLRKYKAFSFINITGLGLGLACCFLIVLYLQHELSYDGFHRKGDRVYRLVHASAQDASDRSAVSAAGYTSDLLQAFPELEQVVRFWTRSGAILKYDAGGTTASGGLAYADPEVFDVFDFRLRRGNPETALENTSSLLVTPRGAHTLFGNEDPMGKTVTFLVGTTSVDLVVTGMLEEVPSNSHLQFNYMVPFSLIKTFNGEDALENYTNYNYFTYLLLRDGITPWQLTAKFSDFLTTYRGADHASNTILQLQPLRDIHLTTDISFDVGTNSDKRYLYIFGGVAVLILMIAGINFMNLATARSMLRAKEVGVRKAVGARRMQLVRQFFSESILASLLAIVLAFAVAMLVAPMVGDLLGRNITLDPLGNVQLVLLLVGIGVLTGVLAGVYPALVLSAFEPSKVLKGLMTGGVRGALLRKGLIVVQFGISVFLIVILMTVYEQLGFMKSRDLGFQKEQVIHFDLSAPVKEHFDTFRQSLLQHPGIQHVALAGNMPGRINTNRGYNWPGQEEEENRSFFTMFVDPYSLETLGLELVQGRNFNEAIPTDETHAYLLNETAARQLGWDDLVYHPFRVWDEEIGQVIGVVRDFHFQSLHQEIEPLVLDIKPAWSWDAAIRVAPGQLTGALDHIKQQWGAMEADLPLNYRFLDEDFDRLYRSEERLGTLFTYFTGLALFIACLGLFGLAAFMAERRTKEIGVRKVLGASTPGIVVLLSKEFARLVLVAFVVAAPLAYFATNRWLESFAYRIELSWPIFLLAGLLVLIVAWLTVSYQAIKAALTNPAQALRYE